MARVATTPRAIARASSVARVDRARPRRRRRRATRSRARGSDVSDDDDDAVAAHALVERRSLLDSDDAEADARRRALANARAIAATADGGDVMRDVDADVLPLLLRLRSAGASAEGLRRGAAGVRAWRDALARGLLPDASLEWPEDETFRTALIEALGDLDMARFTRRFPPVLDTLMKNVLDILYVYERDREDEDATPELPPTEPRDSETANDGEGEGDARGSGAGESDEEEGRGSAR